MSKIRIGIVGYGNLGRGVEASVKLQPDMELVGVFSRRKGLETVSGVPTYTMEDLPNFKGKIDVMVLCGGSATDLIEQNSNGNKILQLYRFFRHTCTYP